jgi:hypothetical protein
MANVRAQGRCGSCAHFRNDPAFLETVFKGLTSMSSGYGSTGGNDGICVLHDRHLSARASCAKYTAVLFQPIGVAPVNQGLKSSADRAIERALME